VNEHLKIEKLGIILITAKYFNILITKKELQNFNTEPEFANESESLINLLNDLYDLGNC